MLKTKHKEQSRWQRPKRSISDVFEPQEKQQITRSKHAMLGLHEKNDALESTKKQYSKSEYTDLKVNIHRRVVEALDSKQFFLKDSKSAKTELVQIIEELLLEEEILIPSTDRRLIIDEIYNEMLGLGPLEPLLNDPSITEIMINGHKQLFIERYGSLTEVDAHFRDEKHLMQIIDKIVTSVGRRVDESQPYCDARLRDGSRFNCIIPPLAVNGASVTIRKFSKDPFIIDDLIALGTLTKEAAHLLDCLVKGRLNILISGGTSSGKTSLLNVLSSFIPEDERIITIEDTLELQLQQRHVISLETRPVNLEGSGEVTQRDLFKNTLRMRPDRIVLGECRAGEAIDMLQAMNTGHDGSITTIHSNTPRDVVNRLSTMVMMSGYDLSPLAIKEQITSALDIIIQISRLNDGSRRITNITEVVGLQDEDIVLQDIFYLKQATKEIASQNSHKLFYSGVKPKFLKKLMDRGVSIDRNLLPFN